MSNRILTLYITIQILFSINVFGQLFQNNYKEIEVFQVKEIQFSDTLLVIQGYAAILTSDQAILSDNLSHKIVYVDLNSGETRFVGSEGRGPGEFDIIYDMFIINDSLFVYDATNLRVQVFHNQSGNLLKTIPIEKPIIGFSKLIVDKNHIYITGKSYDNDLFVHKFSMDGQYINSMIDFIDFSTFFNNLSSRIQLSNINYSIDDDNIYYVLGAPYKIIKINRLTYKEIWNYMDDFLPNPWEDHIVIRPDSYKSRPYPTTVFSEIYKDLLVIYIVNPENEKSYLDLRNKYNGKLVKRLELSSQEFIKEMNSDDDFLSILVTSINDNSIKLYKIKFIL